MITKQQRIKIGIDKRPNELRDIEIECQEVWPIEIFFCQKIDKHGHGYPFPAIIPNRSLDLRSAKLFLLTVTLLTSVDEIWRATRGIKPLKHFEWHGWHLTFIAKKYFPHVGCRRDRNNPFNNQYRAFG